MASFPNENDLRLSIERLMAHNNQNQSRSYPQSPQDNYNNAVMPCPYYPELPHSHSLNTLINPGRQEYVLSEDFFAGYRYNGAMSNVRRFFCLFITFDLCFTTLLWLICIILNGENLHTAIKQEVLQYNIYTSLFDIVMAAICRFVVLLLFYGLLYINHWIIIAVSTSGTCAFLIAKVFTFDWHQSTQPIFPVLLILTSFILAWSETWFLDFKVIPQEWLANVIPKEERAPLVRSYVEGLQSVVARTESNFYSPLDSVDGNSSDDNSTRNHQDRFIDDQRSALSLPTASTAECTFQFAPFEFSELEISKLIEQGKINLVAGQKRAASDEWSVLKTNKIGDVIFAIKVPKLGKMYKIKGCINAAAKLIFNELNEKVDDLPKWNHSLEFSKRIQQINENTDITYQIAKDTGGGLVTPRDFVNLRHWTQMNDGVYVISAVSITHPNLPPRSEYVRGENLLGCWIITQNSNPDEINSRPVSEFEWILHSPIKVWVPQNFIDNAFSNVMFDFMKNLRLHMDQVISNK